MGDREADIFNGLLFKSGILQGSEYIPAEQIAEIKEPTLLVHDRDGRIIGSASEAG